MQTFLTHKGYQPSLEALDNLRANKQIQEAWTIYQIIESIVDGGQYENHPAVRMWRGHQGSLLDYAIVATDIWAVKKDKRRKVSHGLHKIIVEEAEECRRLGYFMEPPPWLGDVNFHRSHRSNLIRKDPKFYSDKFPNTPENMPYLWPQNVPTAPEGYRLRLSQTDIYRLKTLERELPDNLEFWEDGLEVRQIE